MEITKVTGNDFKNNIFSRGDQVGLKTKNEKHFTDFNILEADLKANQVGAGSTFYNQLVQTLNLVNNKVITSDKLSEKLITKPNEVNIHDVTIAAQKAQISLDLTKNVIQRVLTSYQSIINLR